MNYVDKPARFKISNQEFMLIASGNPQKSFILLRMSVRDPGLQMPPLATNEPDTVAVRIVTEWIRGLPVTGNALIPRHSHSILPLLFGNTIRISEDTKSSEIMLKNVRGGTVKLLVQSSGRFQIPAGIKPGLYFLKMGSHVYSILLP
jgi:hypothetical protein